MAEGLWDAGAADGEAPDAVEPDGGATAAEATDAVVLVRRLDGLTYRFGRESADWNGKPSYRRTDLPLWIRFAEADGWAVVDANGIPNGWPTSSGPEAAQGPPRVSWRSQNGAKSYLYDLRDAPATDHEDEDRDDADRAGRAGRADRADRADRAERADRTDNAEKDRAR